MNVNRWRRNGLDGRNRGMMLLRRIRRVRITITLWERMRRIHVWLRRGLMTCFLDMNVDLLVLRCWVVALTAAAILVHLLNQKRSWAPLIWQWANSILPQLLKRNVVIDFYQGWIYIHHPR